MRNMTSFMLLLCLLLLVFLSTSRFQILPVQSFSCFFVFSSPHLCVGFLFLVLHPVRRLLPASSRRLLPSQLVLTHNLSTHHFSSHHLSHHYLSTHNLSSQYLSTHNLSSHHLSSHYLSTHNFVHTQLVITQLVIRPLLITPLVITLLVFTLLVHTQLGLVITPLAHTQLVITRLVFDPPSLCVAGVALDDMDCYFAWQAWHLWHWVGSGGALGSQAALGRRGVLRGRRGTL